MKIVSNTISEPFTKISIKGHMEAKIKELDYDYFANDENLLGESSCHLMDSDEIFKIKNNLDKQAKN